MLVVVVSWMTTWSQFLSRWLSFCHELKVPSWPSFLSIGSHHQTKRQFIHIPQDATSTAPSVVLALGNWPPFSHWQLTFEISTPVPKLLLWKIDHGPGRQRQAFQQSVYNYIKARNLYLRSPNIVHDG